MKLLYKRMLLWTVLVLQISLIFSFSTQSAKESSAISKWFTNGIKTREAFEQEVAAEKNAKGETKYRESAVVEKVARKRYSEVETFVRKTAHFTLFFILGTILMLLLEAYGIKGALKSVPCVIFGMAIAFFDETIQLFSQGRAGLIVDVLIDTAGVAVATIVFLIGGLVYEKIKNRRPEMGD